MGRCGASTIALAESSVWTILLGVRSPAHGPERMGARVGGWVGISLLLSQSRSWSVVIPGGSDGEEHQELKFQPCFDGLAQEVLNT